MSEIKPPSFIHNPYVSMAKSPILIMSIDQDPNTTEVMRWLLNYNEEPIRINEAEQAVSLSHVEDGEVFLQMDGRQLPLKSIKSYWYRRGNWQIDKPALSAEDKALEEESAKFLKRENDAVIEYLHHKLKAVPWLSDHASATGINKDIVLDTAREHGLSVPPSLITGSRQVLLEFLDKHKEIVTKAIRTAIRYYTPTHWLPMYTEELTEEMAQSLPETFGLSLFQKKIPKRYEIRSFFLENEYYSMAIFSQKDAQTATDFRRYKHEKPNRTVPFTLPERIRSKLQKVMKSLGLKTGSIDLMVTPAGEYFFLEVNPIGQFGMTSYPCNYFLERRIAQYLKDGK
ncbi:grasp-with-spasm system ATP-grasp peptide maturase [Roseivirga sp. BDSF3-8]|uniref:grasp-with-spasm system ATP-grasp peptide maturase n=1 Tax=Roseivirga sp. BDSF3-8 TaxID=3241598 RepID=UPI003531C0EF